MNIETDLVTVVCVTYKSHALIEHLAEVLAPFEHVVIVDNASGDGTVGAVRRHLPHAMLVERAENGGFGTGNNDAMRHVRTPYALLLNPDCSLEMPDLLTLLATLQRYPTAGVVAPQSWLADGSAQMCFRQAFYEPRLRSPYGVPDGTCSAKWLHGCCLLVRTEAYNAIGGFDERFFLYYEDDDLCLRLRQAGFDCLFEPAANAQHIGGASSTPSWKTSFSKHYHYARSRHLAIRKYLGIGAAWRYLLKTMVGGPPAAVLYGLLLQPKHALKWTAWSCSAWASAFASSGRK
jgi:GT2 family glycosyltransferase